MLPMFVAINQLHVSWMRMMWLPLVRRDLNGKRYGLTRRVRNGPTLTVIRKPQIHLQNPSYVEEEDGFVDEEFQEDEFFK